MAFEFLVKLNDMVSDPATRIARELMRVEQGLRTLDTLAKRNSLGSIKDPLRRATVELQMQRQQLIMNRNDLGNHSRVISTLADRVRHTRAAMRDWLLILTPLAMGLKFVLNQASQLAHAMVAPVRAAEQASLALKTMFGPETSAALVGQMKELGPRIGRPISEIFQEATKLAVAGVPEELIRPMILALTDMQAMGKDVGKLQYDFAAMFSRPVADLNEMRRGLTGVVDESIVWKHLAQDLGVSIGNANFLMSKNMISGKNLGVAVLEAIQEIEGGALGTVAIERADTTMTSMMDRISSQMEKLFMGMMDTPGFTVVKEVMKNLFDVLSDPRTQGLFNDVANSIGDALKPLTGPEGKRNMEDFFISLKAMIEGILPLLSLAAQYTVAFIGGLTGIQHRDAPKTVGEEINKLFGTAAGGESGIRNAILNEQTFLNSPKGKFAFGYGAELTNTLEDPNDTYTIGDTTFKKKLNSRNAPSINITIPLSIVDAGVYGRNGEFLPPEAKEEALRKLAETLDQINSQSP